MPHRQAEAIESEHATIVLLVLHRTHEAIKCGGYVACPRRGSLATANFMGQPFGKV